MTNDNSHIRAFIAIALPEDIKRSLQGLQGQLRKSGIKASWPNPAAMHLTLKFFKSVPPIEIDAIKTGMTRATKGIPVHTLFAAGLGVFPSVKNTRVIWSGTKGQIDILKKLTYRLEDILSKDMGIKKENRRFLPHLTLARIKQPIFPKTMIKIIDDFQAFQSDDFSASRVSLFQSVLTSSGPVHKNIFSAPFKN
ncbi:MAG: RNA 2',3'-cyclic phosphodiesterase [Proteobacteria bacterium]|nr:RNA 2',3'-cyclic phosphodiesterase [Pseudomonadota bacterium]MBU1581468.1 RNA 2',3'-cyclic phosphodiesterase [Pseudomonadota bacterium]MBU2630701.1 RNA 2',3'-cyclic phosphodiesterase [Pseudomonadota bacterium]